MFLFLLFKNFCTHIFHLKAKVSKLPFMSHFFVLETNFFHIHFKNQKSNEKKLSFISHNSIGIKISKHTSENNTRGNMRSARQTASHNNNQQKHQ